MNERNTLDESWESIRELECCKCLGNKLKLRDKIKFLETNDLVEIKLVNILKNVIWVSSDSVTA